MTKSRKGRAKNPAHLQPIILEIPIHWTPDQALAIFELLDDLKEKIWVRYNCQIQRMMREQHQADHFEDIAPSGGPPQVF